MYAVFLQNALIPMAMLRYIMLLAALVLAGCEIAGPGVEPDYDNVSLRTDDTTYVTTYLRGEGVYREYGFAVIARFENQSGTSVYLSRCYPDSPHPIYGVSLVEPEDQWGAAYSGVWACVGHNRPIEVRTGQVRVDTLRLRGPNAWQDGIARGVFEGQFRLLYEVQTCREEAVCSLPRQYSNVFTVRIEE